MASPPYRSFARLHARWTAPGPSSTKALVLICFITAVGASWAQDPVLEWRRTDWYPTHPVNGAQTQAQSGEDWWYDHKTSYDTFSNVNGFIAAGYSGFVNYSRSEAGTNGCLETSLGPPSCNELETAGNVKGDINAAMALVDPKGSSLIWHKTYNQGFFYRVIQTSDGGYLGVGLTAATRGSSGAPIFYNPNQTSGHVTDQFDGGVACTRGDNVYHIILVKTSASGNVQWQYLYGMVPYRDSGGAPTPDLAYAAAAVGWDVIEKPGGAGYRIVGNAVDPAFSYFCNNQVNALQRAVMIEVSATGYWLNGVYMGPTTAPSNAAAIARYGSGLGLRYVVSGTEQFTGSIFNPYTGCNLFQKVNVKQFQDNWTMDWSRSNFDPDTTKSQSSYDVQISVKNGTPEVLFPIIVSCTGCLYSGYNSGEAKVYRLDTSGLDIPPASDLGQVTAYDLKLRVTPTPDGGFAAVSSKQVNPPPAAYSCYDTSYWNTDAYMARYDAAGIQKWETTFNVDNTPSAPYPADLKKQECMYSISPDADGGFVISGNNSYNFDDAYLAKVGLCTPPPPNMVSWWDDCFPSDRVGPNDGIFVGAPVCPVDSKVGLGALFFNSGTSTYIKVKDNPTLQFHAASFSIDAWIRTGSDSPIMQKGIVNGAGFLFQVNPQGQLSFQACSNSVCAAPTVGHAFVGDGEWHHVAVTVDSINSLATLFADGAVDESKTFSIGSLDSSDTMLIGAAGPPTSPTKIFNGLMDEIEIFSRALSLSEIHAIYVADSAGKCKCSSPPSGMLAWWGFDEMSGSTAKDLAGGHDGSYVNSPIPDPAGRVAGALRLDPGYVVTAGTPFDFGTSDFSIDAWVKYETGSTGELWIVNRGHDFHFAANVQINSPPHLEYACGIAFWPAPIPTDTWTHLAVTVQRNTTNGLKQYVNGKLVGMKNTCAYNISFPGVPLGIGQGGGAGSHNVIDETEVFTRVLAPDEVMAIYESRGAGKCKPPNPDMFGIPTLGGWGLVALFLAIATGGAILLQRQASARFPHSAQTKRDG